MKLNKPKNSNYCATVVEITNLVALNNCDNVCHTIILGNKVIVSNKTATGTVGLFFPVETQLSKEYLSANNLYRHKELNADIEKAGYFEDTGRIRCMKFRGNASEGLFMPLDSLNTLGKGSDLDVDLIVGNEFDEILEVPVCQKYIPKGAKTSGSGNKSRDGKQPKETKIIENQFRFHKDTAQLWKNLHVVKPTDLISLTYKMHGTSGISAKVLCKNAYRKRDRFGEFMHNLYTKMVTFGKYKFNLTESNYDNIYSSRKVIKNPDLNPNAQHYSNEDIWGAANDKVKEFLEEGMTFYYEVVGEAKGGALIQKGFDYGYPKMSQDIKIGDKVCKALSNKPFKSGLKENTVVGVINHPQKEDALAYTFKEDNSYVECSKCFKKDPFGVYIYRITHTSSDGKVFEYSMKQVQDFCKDKGLNAVPLLFYGFASEFSDERLTETNWGIKFLETLKERYNEKDCYMCTNKVPEEGVVVRVESNELVAFKCKSTRFLEFETKELDKGEVNIEDEN